MAKTASRESQEVRTRANDRHAFFGFARWSTEDASPAATSASPKSAPRHSAASGRCPKPSTSASTISASNPNPTPELTVKKMMLAVGFMG
jgi:hypothetical protein